MTIVVITGGRERVPRLTEFDAFAAALPEHATLRHGKARGTDRAVGSWVQRRQLCDVEEWPADDSIYGPWPACGHARNRAMLDGKQPGKPDQPPATMLIAFAGGPGTAGCVKEAAKRGIPITHIAPVVEPLVVNRHHYKPGEIPRPWIYVGRGSPLGNPFTAEEHGAEAISKYRRWLWDKLQAKDASVLAALEEITPTHGLVCSCWPKPCHADVIVRAWKYHQQGAPP